MNKKATTSFLLYLLLKFFILRMEKFVVLCEKKIDN